MATSDDNNTKEESNNTDETKEPTEEEKTGDKEQVKEDENKNGDEEAKDATIAEETTEEAKEEAAPATPAPTTPAPETPAGKKNDDDDDDEGGNQLGDSSSKRRFFPRVKHLLTREWAYFLSGVLDALEQSGACITAAASHKVSNPWYKAFDLVYGGIAAECSIPTGKNRYHKFKDKIVELWTAMETQAPEDHPLKQRAVDQLEAYRKACEEQQLQFIKADDPKLKTPISRMPPEKAAMPPGAGSAAALGKQSLLPAPSAAAKRSYASMMPNAGIRWKHVDEMAIIKKLPQPLQNFLHLRHLGTELKARSTVEISFQKHLDRYLKQDCEKEDLYDKALCLASLHRQAQSNKESKEIMQAYERVVSEYLSHVDPPRTGTSV